MKKFLFTCLRCGHKTTALLAAQEHLSDEHPNIAPDRMRWADVERVPPPSMGDDFPSFTWTYRAIPILAARELAPG